MRRRRPLIQVDRDADRELTLVEQLSRDAQRDWPGVTISLGMHLAALVLLALIPRLLEQQRPIGVINLEWASESPAKAPVKPPAPVQLTNPIRLTKTTPVAAPTPVPLSPTQTQTTETAPSVQPVDAGSSLNNRMARGQGGSGNREGFNDDARQAIDRGLKWLVKQQAADGHWSLDGPYADGATRTRWSTDVGATALALLALQGDGQTHTTGDFADNVGRGLQWLKSRQRPSGELYDGAEEGEEPSIYSHAMSVIVLCEALAMTGDAQFREPAIHGVKYLVAAQNPVRGGWGYRPLVESGEGDLSVSGWALSALHTARMAGLEVDPQAYLLASSFLDRCQETPADAARYKYRPSYPPDREQRVSMTASGLLARQWLGWPRNLGPMQAGGAYLLSDDARPDWGNGHRNVYAWYYQAQVLHNLGGDRWRNWFADLQELVVSQQLQTGKESGSWHPNKPPGSVHEYSAIVGRLYITVMSILILETPFRHAPLYRETEG
ncbi:MAG: prenyltransferase/squalene oxidase repeat-containing protein [Planctomycetaceae bacterium]